MDLVAVTEAVGASSQSSNVILGDEIVLQALQGYNGIEHNGGDGYSGGGGGYGLGGSDGGNGEDGSYTGGKGSGLNLEHMAMTHFVLTPAEGGKPSNNYYG